MFSDLYTRDGKLIGEYFFARSSVTVIDCDSLETAINFCKKNNLNLILPEENSDLPDNWEMSFVNSTDGRNAFFKYALSRNSKLLQFANIVVLRPPTKPNLMAA